MRRFLLLFLLLVTGPFALHAQDPEEEYYPFQNRFEEEYQPMISTDTTLFLRAIQTMGDLYGETTDFRFSFVAYNRRGEAYRPDRTSLNGLKLGSRYISALKALGTNRSSLEATPWFETVAADPGFRTSGEMPLPAKSASLQLSGRNYLAGLKLSLYEDLGRGWEVAALLQGRTGRDLYVDGVFSNQLTAALKATKSWNTQNRLSILTILPPSMRGLRSSSTREAFSLIGDNLYNPAWGYQDGKVRSARIRREFVPLTAIAWQHEFSPTTRLDLTFTAETGIRRYSSLAWYNARTPIPDNYREMPSYFTDSPETQRALEEIWRANDPHYTQIDWDYLYEQNRLSPDGESAFAVTDRVERITDLQLSADGETLVGERLTIRYGIQAACDRVRRYREMRDLLGGDHIVDLDQYLIDDDTYGNLLQNNLRDPDREIREGDRFGYDYHLQRSAIDLGASAEYQADRFRLFFAAKIGESTLSRHGYYEKELFSGSRSYGKSRTLRFMPYLLRGNVGYSLSARHYLELSVALSAQMPEGDDLFLNPEYNNRPVDRPIEEKRYEAELEYTWSGRNFRFKAGLFAIRTTDGFLVRHYYDDAAYAYSDMVASDIGTMRYGIEAAAFLRLASRWNLNLAFSAGSYRYADNPLVTIYADTDNAVIDCDAESYMGDCRLGNTPQITGLVSANYYGHRGWGFRFDAAYAGQRYVEPALVRRTTRIARQLADSPEAFDLITRQERLADAFTLDMTLFKSFYFDNSRLTFMLSVQNLLGLRDQIFSGYESMRVPRIPVGDTYVYRPMDSRYLYAYPRTFYFAAFFSF